MTFAQFVGNGTSGIVGVLSTIIVPFIGALAFAVLIWGILNYFFFNNNGDATKLAEGRTFILWGILGIVVLFSVWGLVSLLLSTLGIAPTS
jgi:hypothetical protein